MKIQEITIQNFRSFGAVPTTVRLNGLSALIGANGTGKSNALLALVRLFGATGAERTLGPADVHVPSGSRLEDLGPVTLTIEARLALPEIAEDPTRVAEVFNQMVVEAPGGAPYCRARLQGTWSGGAAEQGEMDASLAWISSSEAVPDPKTFFRMTPADRSRIQVHYVPAVRDPARQLRAVSTALFARLLRSVEFSPAMVAMLASTSKNVRLAFQAEPGVATVSGAVESVWAALNDTARYARVGFSPIEADIDSLLRRVELLLGPAPHASEVPVDGLSDGQKSLFYLSLIGSVFALEAEVRLGKASTLGLNAGRVVPPALTLLAVEEPENHLAPHYLARIMDLLSYVGGSAHGQVLLTSHSPAILGRVQPEDVRHLRMEAVGGVSSVKEITLPPMPEAHKFIRQAVLAYPEMYFSKLVVLGEGDSEVILLPRLARALGQQLDHSFVSVVPLGGRHVNHMWRLLGDLGIPHVTLLDLDRERFGGGWARVHYAVTQLLAHGLPPGQEFRTSAGALTSEQLATMPKWDTATLPDWLGYLEQWNVFFSTPLDVDFSMLFAFPAAYKQTAPATGGPRLPTSARELAKRRRGAVRAVLKDQGGDGKSFLPQEIAAFPWYANLFLGRGKPTTHLLALGALSDAELQAGMPVVFQRLLTRVRALLG